MSGGGGRKDERYRHRRNLGDGRTAGPINLQATKILVCKRAVQVMKMITGDLVVQNTHTSRTFWSNKTVNKVDMVDTAQTGQFRVFDPNLLPANDLWDHQRSDAENWNKWKEVSAASSVAPRAK